MRKELHICFVEAGYPHPHGGGGAGTFVEKISQELVKRGHIVSVVANYCTDCPIESDDHGVKIYRPPIKSGLHWYVSKIPLVKILALPLRTLEWGRQVYRFIQNLHHITTFDLVEFTEGGDFWHAMNAPFPFICHLHGSRYTVKRMSGRGVDQSEWINRKLELFFIQRASWILSPSYELLQLSSEEARETLKPSSVIPYPVNAEFREKDTFSQRDGKRVFFVARHDPVKGADVLLNAIPMVREEVPDVTFDFFGYQASPDQVLPEGVVCHGFLPKERLLAQYPTADICVLPSLWDNSPNSIYEAMAAGKAVVASRVGGIPELVIDEETGLLFPPGDAKTLAISLVTLLNDDDKRIRMGIRGRERILELAEVGKNMDQRLEIYYRVIEGHKSSS